MAAVKKKGIGLLAGAGVGAAAAAALRRRWAGKRVEAEDSIPVPGSPGAVFMDHLAEAVRIPTVGYEDRSRVDTGTLDRFHSFLESTYPLVHRHLKRELVGGHSLLYTWEGADPGSPGALLMGHMDVVGVEPGTEGDWEHPPFAGERDERFLWGRGTQDDKGSVVAILEAVESLLGEGFSPDVTLYLSFGHDEETGGAQGAAAVAALLAERRVHLDFVLDEGGSVITGFPPGSSAPVALVGIGEKGYLNVELAAVGTGGHSAVPPTHTTIGALAGALQSLEACQFPARFDAQAQFFAAVAPALGGVKGALLKRAAGLGRLLERRLSANPTSNALIRTTTAVTMIEGGVKPNVLPQQARAVVNFRLLPGDTREMVLAHVREVVGSNIAVQPLPAAFSAEASPVADTASASFGLIIETIHEVLPGSIVAPWIMLGATDARHFSAVADNVYRFAPFRVTMDDMGRLHGTGERVRLADGGPAVAFYRRLVQRACGTG